MITVQPLTIRNIRDAVAEMVKGGAPPEAIERAASLAVHFCISVRGASPETAGVLEAAMIASGGSAFRSDAALMLCGTLGGFGNMLAAIPPDDRDEIHGCGDLIKRTLLNIEGGVPPPPLAVRGRIFEWGGCTHIMGILNATPDSFYAASRRPDFHDAVEAAAGMIADGADIIDVGGESSRPGSEPVAPDEEIARVVPVVREIRTRFPDSVISIDTYRARTAVAALEAGADMINDISGLAADADMPRTAAESGAPVCIMHIRGTPRDMQREPRYERDVCGEIIAELRERMDVAIAAGVSEENIIIDPGIGFGKTAAHNMEILSRLREFRCLGRPVLAGASRKSFIGKTLGLPEDERLEGSLAAAAIAVAGGADILRVHDVRQTLLAARVADAILRKPRSTRPDGE